MGSSLRAEYEAEENADLRRAMQLLVGQIATPSWLRDTGVLR